MEYERKGVIITWLIENVKCPFKQNIQLYSPVMCMDVMDGTKWKLYVDLIPAREIMLVIKREAEDQGPEKIGLHFDCSIIPYSAFNQDTTVRRYSFEFYKKNDRSSDHLLLYVNESLISDKITIRCKIWRLEGSIPMNNYFFLRTRVKIERSIFVGVVENFSTISSIKKTLKTIVSPTGEIIITVNFYLFASWWFKIDIDFVNNGTRCVYDFQLFILDSSGSKSSIEVSISYIQYSSVTISLDDINKEKLMKNSALYLPNDTLSLHCELEFSSENEYEKVESEYESDSVTDVKQTNFSNDLELLTRREGIPFDTKLHTATEEFKVHTNILSAQSPVFEAMFNTNMKETIQRCVHIDDVDAETVKHMLVFLYSGTLEELEWKNAMKLFVAADKYQILSLKQKCAAFLKLSVDLSNCIVLLLLADMHQDKDLKIVVKRYIAYECEMEVLCCDQWRDFEKNVPQLAIEYFRNRCVKKHYWWSR